VELRSDGNRRPTPTSRRLAVKAAIVTQPNQTPTYDAFGDPAAQNGFELITVTASALFPLTKSRAAGSHYSSPDTFPMVVGVDGVGITCTGQRVYFCTTTIPLADVNQTWNTDTGKSRVVFVTK
jgi:hypothetical protein